MLLKKNTAHLFVVFLFIFSLACSSSSSDSTSEDAFTEISGELFSIVANDTDATSCTVYGEDGRELGSGSPDALNTKLVVNKWQ